MARTWKNIRTDTASQDGFVVRNAVAVSNAESIIAERFLCRMVLCYPSDGQGYLLHEVHYLHYR